jgi:RNA polymerase sigma-70 factor (ECF subfamily)
MDAQRRERLSRAVQELPLTDRQIIVLYLEGLTAAEIEGVTGINAGAIATRLSRLRAKLSEAIRREENPA